MAAPVHSQIVIDNSVALSGPGPTTTCTVTPATDEGLLMAVSFDLGSGATVSVASTGQSDVWTLVESVDEAGSQGLRVFKCLAPANPGVSRAIVATFTPDADSRVSAVVGFTGASKTTVASNKQHQATPTTTTDAVSSLTATPPVANSLQYGFSFANHGAAAPAAGTGFTSVSTMWNYGASDVARVERKTLSSTTAVAATFTAGTNTNHLTITVIVPEAQDNPTVSSLTPADDATGVSVSTTLAATFNQNVSAGTGNVNVYEYTAPSSAPTVQTRNTDAQQTNATSFVVDTPGTPIAGDLQIIAFSKDDNEAPTGTWPPTGFQLGQSDATGTTNWAGWIYRWCDGSTDPSTVTLTESSENWLSRGWLIRGADPDTNPVGGTVATGTSAAANPPSVAFPGDAGDPCLVLYYVGFDGNASASAHPGGYTDTGTNTTTDATTGNRCGQAYGELASSTAGSDNPGALTNTNEDWKAFTIAIRGKPTDALIETISITDGSKVSISSATVTVDPAATLNSLKLHYVNIDSGAIVASDDSAPFLGIAGRTTWNFTTGAAPSGPGGAIDVDLPPLVRRAPDQPTLVQGFGQAEPIPAGQAIQIQPPRVAPVTQLQPSLVAGFGQAAVAAAASVILSVVPAPVAARTQLPPQPTLVAGAAPVAPVPAGTILASRLPPRNDFAGVMLITGIGVPDPEIGILQTTLAPAQRLPPRPQVLSGVAPAVAAPTATILQAKLPPGFATPFAPQVLQGFGQAAQSPTLTQALAPLGAPKAPLAPQLVAGFGQAAQVPVIVTSRPPDAAPVVPPAPKLLAGVVPIAIEAAGTVVQVALPLDQDLPPRPTLLQGFGQPAVDPAGSALAVALPSTRDLLVRPQLIAGFGQPVVVPAGSALTVSLAPDQKLPPKVQVLPGFGEAAQVAVLLRSEIAPSLPFPPRPTLTAGVVVPPVAVLLQALPAPVAMTPPPAPGLFAGVLPPPIAPIPLAPLTACSLPLGRLPPPLPQLVAGTPADVVVPYRPVEAARAPLAPKAQQQPQLFAGVAPLVIVPLAPLVAASSPPFAKLPPQAVIVTGFGQATPPDANFSGPIFSSYVLGEVEARAEVAGDVSARTDVR